jgi:hypothetical protein
MLDMMRPYQTNHFPGPLIPAIDVSRPGTAFAGPGTGIDTGEKTPTQLNASVWCSIIHGALGILYFDACFSGPGNVTPGFMGQNNFGDPYFQAPRNAATISIYDQARVTNYLVATLTPVIYSQFAEGTSGAHFPGYVTVKGDNLGGTTPGYRAPYRPGDFGNSANENAPYPNPSISVGGTCPNYNFNVDLSSNFEVMAKCYQGNTQTVNGITITKNQFWLFADYRGSAQDGTNGANANALVASFTLAAPAGTNGATATSVDRFYADAVLGAVSNGAGGTTITCGETQQMATGDQVIISGTLAGLNGGPYNILSTNRTRTTFDINLASPPTFSFSITAATWISNQATFTTSAAHGFSVGQVVQIVGVGLAGYNQRYIALAGTTGNTIVVFQPFSPGGSSSGGTAAVFGTLIARHNITVTGGTTFSDTFPQGSCIGIYRVN